MNGKEHIFVKNVHPKKMEALPWIITYGYLLQMTMTTYAQCYEVISKVRKTLSFLVRLEMGWKRSSI